MITPKQLFAQFGAGREGWWEEKVWRAVLGVLAKHNGEQFTQASNPSLFDELEDAISSVGSEMSPRGEDETRTVFRAAPAAWVETRVATLDKTIQLTENGRSVLNGSRSYADCLQDMFVRYRENRNGKNPFRPILELLSDGNRHDFPEVFERVQRECGPELQQWIQDSKIQGFPYSIAPDKTNPVRSVKFQMQLLGFAKLVEGDKESGWKATDVQQVTYLRDSIEAESAKNPGVSPASLAQLDTGPIIQEITGNGWEFAPWQIVTFCNALRTKPFVVLAGISGTGKTKLPRLVAAATGAHYELIPVRPDWRDSSDLLGFTDLSGAFHPGPLLRAAKAAIENPHEEFFVLLDEMNLARVEYYFAEVLSLIEERRLDASGGYSTSPLLSMSTKIREEDNEDGMPWHQVYLPSNLAVIGSVNMDETTHPFSRKVLDRAFVIEFSDVDLNLVSNGSGVVEEVTSVGAAGWRPEAIRLAEHQDSNSEIVNEVISELIQVNEILKRTQLQVGYRLRDELALFVLNMVGDTNLIDSNGLEVDPIDLALCMKILPRVQGGGPQTSDLLRALSDWAGPKEDPRLPICSARIEILIQRFEAEGFTSFWL